MMDVAFLRAFGKVLFSVTADAQGLADEEKMLLTEAVKRTLMPFLSTKPDLTIWRALFDFDTREVLSADALVAGVVRAGLACPGLQQAGIQMAALDLLTRMTATFARSDQGTQVMIAALEEAWGKRIQSERPDWA
jgi:hypothetical protein